MNIRKKIIIPSLAILLASNLYAAKLYTVESTSLKDAILRISKTADMPYLVDTNILKGKISKEIKNIEGLENALDALLEGSGLKAVIKNKMIMIKKISANNSSSLGEIDILAKEDQGSSKKGYLVNKTSDIGVLKGKSLQDTPYSLNIMSEDYMENLQATSTDALYSINPVMQVNTPQSQNDNGYVNLRGFKNNVSAFDGMRREKWQWTHNTNIEEYERLETITGLSGFLYGPSPIGGLRNFIPKRPTQSEEYSVTLGNAGGSGPYVHADLSSPIDEKGTFAYRLNVVVQDGETNVENQNLKKNVINFALDYNISDNILLQGLISDSYYRLDGLQPRWYLGTGATRPDATLIDSNKLWGQEWSFQETQTRRYNTKLLWDISESVSFRAAIMKEKTIRSGNLASNTISSDDTYSQTITNNTNEDEIVGKGAYAFLDFAFDTKGINHQATIGMQASDSFWNLSEVDDSSSISTVSGLSLSSPTSISKATDSEFLYTDSERYHLSSRNFTLGDSITFNPQWSLLLGASHVTLKYEENNYNESTVTPSISIVYKPIEELSLYANYMEGIELGGIASDTNGAQTVTNGGEAMDPLKSNQIEIGAKYTYNNILYTLALFNIDKGLEYYDTIDTSTSVYVQDGRQVHKGLEFTMTGKLVEDLTVIGGFTLLDAKVKENKANSELEGKTPKEVSELFAKLYLEYTPFKRKDISLNTGINYTGSYYSSNDNTEKLPSYTLFNIGARYATQSNKYPLTYRFNINNLTDKEYWVNSNYLGDRRTIHASVTMKF